MKDSQEKPRLLLGCGTGFLKLKPTRNLNLTALLSSDTHILNQLKA